MSGFRISDSFFPTPTRLDVLIVSMGSTTGLRMADDELLHSLRRAGADAHNLRIPRPEGETPTLVLTDLEWAIATRLHLKRLLRGMLEYTPRALIYSSTTAAMFWPAPGAIRFDAPAAGNRRGRHGPWQRPLERRRLRQAPLLLPWSEGSIAETPRSTRRPADTLIVPMPVEPSGPPLPRDIAAVTYASNPSKKGLDRVLRAWRRVRLADEQLVVTGVDEEELQKLGFPLPIEGVRIAGHMLPENYRTLLRRAHVFVCAPRREDYGIAQLEALADGCLLVSTPAPGPYAALPIARAIDPRLIDDDLGTALRAALDDPVADYAERALEALAPYRRESCDAIVAEQLLPRLLPSEWSSLRPVGPS
jgi:hypothetical protein